MKSGCPLEWGGEPSGIMSAVIRMVPMVSTGRVQFWMEVGAFEHWQSSPVHGSSSCIGSVDSESQAWLPQQSTISITVRSQQLTPAATFGTQQQGAWPPRESG